MNPTQPLQFVDVAPALAGAAAVILLAPRGGTSPRSIAVFAGPRARQQWDYLLLAGTVLGFAMHAAIARPLLKILSVMEWEDEGDVLAFWVMLGPTVAAWCACCVAARWGLRHGLTSDGRLVWLTLILVGVNGWAFSLMGAFLGTYRFMPN